MLSSRMKQVLRELLAADTPVTGEYLATVNHVTARTTREDIKNLDALLNNHGAKIISVISKGYTLEIWDKPVFQQYLHSIFVENTLSHVSIPKTPEDRVTYIIIRFLLNDHYLKLDDLADELFVSKSTIQQDIKNVKEILQKYDITLEARPNYGLKAVGDEIKVRFCLSEYVLDRKKQSTNTIDSPLPSIFDDENMEAIQEIILRQIKKYQITLSDIAINNLFIHIVIARKRIISGHYVAIFHADMDEIEQQREYHVANEIAKEVEELYQIKFPQAEIAYIAMHLLGTKLVTQKKGHIDHVIEDDILQLVDFVLAKMEEKLDLGISKDEELIFGMSMHLKPAVNRIKYGMNIRNPMLQEIKNNYPLAYEAGIIAGLAIKEYTEIEMDENEIGYLALHIGAAMERKKLHSGPKRCLVVCASGLGTAQLIYYRLKSYFGSNLEVIGTTEYYMLDQYNLNEIDFIVSSIPIKESFAVPVIEVNAILKESDLKAIEKFILTQSNHQPMESFFLQDLVFFKQALHTKEEVLAFLHGQLMEQGFVGKAFLEAVYEREKVAPTSYGNLVAIPHPITPQTEKTFLCVCTLDKPIDWNNNPVQIVFLLCVKRNSQEDLQEMYDVLGKFIEDHSSVHKILKASSYEEFLRIMKEA
ncbi:BglG family transcription antiterminator [Niallia circulans]|uniref:BglG family transcription antiterminator n=2 Tax=Bacillaceae TaxID=186817 RepID=UPI001F4918FE|nr:BglG family transcription antiterminator [Niallia circulans]MCF2647879.1 transcription antiterminator [Niallia circulans]CAI9394087.1 putative licABCH operon regulator [Bacillus sp. T2.9-1]